MLPVRCFTGHVIADKLDRYLRLKSTMGSEAALDTLGVRHDCCRVHFITYRSPLPDTCFDRETQEIVPGIAEMTRRCPGRRWVVAR